MDGHHEEKAISGILVRLLMASRVYCSLSEQHVN